MSKDINISNSALYLFGEGFEQKIKDQTEAVQVSQPLSLSQSSFFQGVLLKEAALGGADTSCSSVTSRTSTQKVLAVQKRLSRSQPPEGEDIDNSPLDPQKGSLVSRPLFLWGTPGKKWSGNKTTKRRLCFCNCVNVSHVASLIRKDVHSIHSALRRMGATESSSSTQIG